jgi:hypothetical protein
VEPNKNLSDWYISVYIPTAVARQNAVILLTKDSSPGTVQHKQP